MISELYILVSSTRIHFSARVPIGRILELMDDYAPTSIHPDSWEADDNLARLNP